MKQDLAQAEALFGRAAAQGHIQASDNYGLLLFQRGERTKALPYVIAATERGDPRAQYLLGLSHFNGDQVAKDWVRAYALVSLANQAGLEQARAALAQMDQYVPLDQRQQAVALAADLAGQADAVWAKASRRPELAGHPRINVPAGEAIRVQAGGFASQGDAQAACNRLSAAGITCLPMRN